MKLNNWPVVRLRKHARNLLVIPMLLSGFLLVGCDRDSGPDSVMPSKMDGANGEHVAVTGLSSGATVPCSKVSGDVWSFNVPFEAKSSGVVTAQLLVEVENDTAGQSVWGSNRGPYVQSGSTSLGSGVTGGVLGGRIGPPVSDSVRFGVAIRIVDSSGAVVAVSERVPGLHPKVQ